MRILVAQQNPSRCADLAAQLGEHDFEVVCVEDGVQALNALATGPFAGLVLAVDLPLVDGLQILLRLRSDDTWRNVPALLTGGHLPWSREEARSRLGAVDWFPEPFQASDVAARLFSQLGLVSGTVAAAPVGRLRSLRSRQRQPLGASWPHLYTVMLVDIFRSGADGTLHLGRRDADQLQVVFLAGFPTWAFRGREPWADLASFLRSQGAVSEDQLGKVEALRGLTLAERLAKLQEVVPSLSPTFKEYVESRLLEPLGWRSGVKRFSKGEDQAVKLPFCELHSIQIVSRHLGRLIRRSEITSLLEQLGNIDLAATHLARPFYPWLTAQQVEVLDGLSAGAVPAQALASMLGETGEEALFVLFALGCLGTTAASVDLGSILRPAKTSVSSRGNRRRPPAPLELGVASEPLLPSFLPPAEPGNETVELPEMSCPTGAALCAPLEERRAAIGAQWGRSADSQFEVLGLSPDAPAGAFSTRSTSLSALLLPGGLPPSLQAKALSLRRRLILSRYTLRDPQARRRAAHEHAVGVARRPHPLRCPLVRAPIRQGFLSGGREPPMESVEGALALLYAEQWEEALATLELITRENPMRLDAALALAWAQFQAGRGLQRAMDSCQLAERIEPEAIETAETRARVLLVSYRKHRASGGRPDAGPLRQALKALEVEQVAWATKVGAELPVPSSASKSSVAGTRGRWFGRT